MKNDDGRTPLFTAVFKNSPEMVTLLIEGGADVTVKDNIQGLSPIHFASSKEVAEILIANGADAAVTDDSLYTPLHFAAQIGSVELGQVLLDNGADVNAKIELGYIPIYFAAEGHHKDFVNFLIENGADIENMELHYASCTGDIDKVKELIESGADVNSKGEIMKVTPLHWASTAEVASLLIENGADVNALDDYEETPSS